MRWLEDRALRPRRVVPTWFLVVIFAACFESLLRPRRSFPPLASALAGLHGSARTRTRESCCGTTETRWNAAGRFPRRAPMVDRSGVAQVRPGSRPKTSHALVLRRGHRAGDPA